MKSRTITILLGCIIVVIFGLMFLIIDVYFDNGNTYQSQLNQIKSGVKEEKWVEVDKNYKKIMKKWNVGKYLIAINYAEHEYDEMDTNLNELGSAIENEDKDAANKLIEKVIHLYQKFDDFVPLP